MSIESESRQVKVLTLYARGLTQAEIAGQLGVQQSTVSKDLKKIRKKMKKEVKDVVSDDLWTYAKYLSGVDAAISRVWEIAEDKSIAPRDRIHALSLLRDFYENRGDDMIVASQYFRHRAKDEKMYGGKQN